MREVYENRAAAKERGLAGSAHVRRAFSWERAADIAEARIRDLFRSDRSGR